MRDPLSQWISSKVGNRLIVNSLGVEFNPEGNPYFQWEFLVWPVCKEGLVYVLLNMIDIRTG